MRKLCCHNVKNNILICFVLNGQFHYDDVTSIKIVSNYIKLFVVCMIKFQFSYITSWLKTKKMRRDGELAFRVQGVVHFLINRWHSLTELSNQDADEKMRGWGKAWAKLTCLCSRWALRSVTFDPVNRAKTTHAEKVSVLSQRQESTVMRSSASRPETRIHHRHKHFKAFYFFSLCSEIGAQGS